MLTNIIGTLYANILIFPASLVNFVCIGSLCMTYVGKFPLNKNVDTSIQVSLLMFASLLRKQLFSGGKTL